MKFIGDLLKQHLQRYPRMELADIYKLLHQAALGSAHALTNPQQASDALLQEMNALDATGGAAAEPLLDLISPDGKLARVHLRAYRAGGHDPAALARAFVATAQSWTPARDKLARFCGCLGDLAAAAPHPFAAAFEPEQVRAYVARLVEAGYPLTRHSDAYRDAYRPAYRVVNIDLLDIARSA